MIEKRFNVLIRFFDLHILHYNSVPITALDLTRFAWTLECASKPEIQGMIENPVPTRAEVSDLMKLS